jgi:phosphoserine phosphatase
VEGAVKAVVICDLDGTLVQANTMELQFRQAIRKSKVAIFSLVLSIIRGRLALKKKLTELVPVLDKEPVPNSAVIGILAEFRNENREIYLVSASEHKFVCALGMKLFQFDGIIGSSEVNLKGINKAKLLVQKFGTKNFEYIGDSFSDVHVWREAYSGIAVSPKGRTLRTIQNEFLNVRVIKNDRN